MYYADTTKEKHMYSSVYGYGVVVPFSALGNEKAEALLKPALQQWVTAREAEKAKEDYRYFKHEEYEELLSEVIEYEERELLVADLAGYPSASEEVFSIFINDAAEDCSEASKDYVGVEIYFEAFDEEGKAKSVFIHLFNTTIFLNFQKVSEAEKPSEKRKAALARFLEDLGVDATPKFDSVNFASDF